MKEQKNIETESLINDYCESVININTNFDLKVIEDLMGLTCKFKGISVSTSQEVSHNSLELISDDHDKFMSLWSEEYEPYWTNGVWKNQNVQFTLSEGESVIILHNDQNQIDTYYKVSNINKKIRHSEICHECFYTNYFQGRIGNREVTEEEYREFVKSL